MKVDLNEIKASLEAIKGTKWAQDDNNGVVWSNEADVVIEFSANEEGANINLIANAPEWLASLVEQVEEMKKALETIASIKYDNLSYCHDDAQCMNDIANQTLQSLKGETK